MESNIKREMALFYDFAGLAYFIIFKYIPMWGIVIAFQDYSPFLGVLGSEWVGLEHFKYFFYQS